MSDINIWKELNVIPQKNQVEEFPTRSELNIELQKENGLTEPKIGVEEHNTKLKLNNKKRGRKNKKSNENNILAVIHDKFSNDNLKRKIKTHYHLFIIAFLNKISKHILGQTIKFGKISSYITQNITVEYNRRLLDTKIKDIVTSISDKYHDKDRNKIIVDLILNKSNKDSEIIKFLNISYKDFFLNYYLKSTKKIFEGELEDESYEAHIEKLQRIYGKKYIENFKRNAISLVSFFYKSKRRKRKEKTAQLINPKFINNDFQDYEKNNFQNGFCFEEKKKYFVSTSTQTEIHVSDDEYDYSNN